MACVAFVDPATGAAGHACLRGVKAKYCGCGAVATLQCDGRIPGARGRRRRCAAYVCAAHATPVDAERDHCPDCAAAAAPAGAPAGVLVAYTDGSGTVAELPCGGGVVLFDGGRVVAEAARHFGNGTNNVAELKAVGVALVMTADAGRALLVRTDSMYVIGALTGGAPHPYAANVRLIVELRASMRGRDVWFEHVPGHAGVWGNERADELANRGRLHWHPPPRRAT